MIIHHWKAKVHRNAGFFHNSKVVDKLEKADDHASLIVDKL